MNELTADLSGSTALITGASSGLGAHFARLLAGSGASVILAARRIDALEELVTEIERDGGQARAARLDTADPASIDALFGAIEPIDILVNNAGIALTKPALDQDAADWDRIMNVNLRGAFLVATAGARGMRRDARGGSIINIASILGLQPGNQVSTYAISKAGLIHMTKSLALELARFGIRVNAIAPGYISTELNESQWQTEAGKAIIKRIPQRRLGELSDLDGPLLLLASDASRFMTGSVIAVDGGHLLSSL